MYYYKKKSMWIFTPEEKESAKNISVVDYLTKNYGFTFKKEGRNYRCREHDSFVVKQDERTWYWNSRRLGGGDVIEFVSQFENKSYADALVAIINPTHSERPRYHTAPTVSEPEEKVLELVWSMDKIFMRTKEVIAFLLATIKTEMPHTHKCVPQIPIVNSEWTPTARTKKTVFI